MPKKISFDEEAWERNARKRAAWGQFAVTMQRLNFNQESSQLQEKMRRSGSRQNEIDEAVDELRKKRTSHHLLIG